jgi:hypothetical protein
MTLRRVWLVALMILCGCADEPSTEDCSKEGGGACFVLPQTEVAAYSVDGTRQALSLGCGGLTVSIFANASVLSGVTKDPISNANVPDTQLVVFGSTDLVDALATTKSDASGAYSVSLPAGSPNVLSMRWAARRYMPATLLLHVFDPSSTTLELDPLLVTPDEADIHAALVRATYDHEKSLAFVFAHDCHGSRLEHAVVVISSRPKQRAFIDGVVIAYTGDQALVPELLSVRPNTSTRGAAAAINIPPNVTLYAQAWGFPDLASVEKGEAGLVLIDEFPFSVEPRALIGIELHGR